MEPNSTAAVSTRDDRRYDVRRVVVYFLGLIAFCAGVVAVVRPGQGDIDKVALGIMFAPTVGAIFLPPLVILVTTWAASIVTDVSVNSANLASVVLARPGLRAHGLPVGHR